LWASGMRREELCNLDIEHVDLETGFIKIMEGKGGQYRTAFTNDDAIMNLRSYIQGLKLIGYPGKALFFTERRERIKPDTLTKWLIRRSHEVGLHLTPHMFRHGLGRNMRRNGAPLEDIADVLGHRSLTSTRIYATLGSKEVKKNYDKYHALPA
jgi:integrase/recombinase XerD